MIHQTPTLVGSRPHFQPTYMTITDLIMIAYSRLYNGMGFYGAISPQ